MVLLQVGGQSGLHWRTCLQDKRKQNRTEVEETTALLRVCPLVSSNLNCKWRHMRMCGWGGFHRTVCHLTSRSAIQGEDRGTVGEEEEGLTLECCYPQTPMVLYPHEGTHSPHSTLTLGLGGRKEQLQSAAPQESIPKDWTHQKRTLGLPSAAGSGC